LSMKIFLIEHDPDFATLVPDGDLPSATNLNFQADIVDDLQLPRFKVDDKNKPLGNFIYLNESTLVFDSAVDRVAAEVMEMAAAGTSGAFELFELEVEELDPLYLLNVIEVSNSVNKQASSCVAESWQDCVTKPGALQFHEKRVFSQSSLFKVPELAYTPVLTFHGKQDQEHDFFSLYNDNGFTGLRFTELWST